MNTPELYNESNRATYCPEDDKIRLYVGRVPRAEYEALRAEGWTSTPKQECDFVAVWTPRREDTALSYAGIIEDEDAGPEERAADRAERFAGYREKRIDEATGHADRYDAGPSAHGYQSAARAERAAARHDRIGGRAVNAWDKAEYWQRRTAGVIGNALYKSSPSVRMGRIKTIEAEQRKIAKDYTEAREAAQHAFDVVQRVIDHAEGRADKVLAIPFLAYSVEEVKKGRKLSEDFDAGELARLASLRAVENVYRYGSGPESIKTMSKEAERGTRPAVEIAREWITGRTRPEDWKPEESRAYMHTVLRLAYENQMLEAQGGRAAHVEMVPGGFIGGKQIVKVNKSNATGRVVSVAVRVPTNGRDRWGNEDPKAPPFRLEQIKTERLAGSAYRAPTEEELAAFKDAETAAKKAAPKVKAPALVNPTLEDAERLQALWNAQHAARRGRGIGSDEDAATVCAVTQAEYSAASKGAYARAETVELCGGGEISEGGWSTAARIRAARLGPVVCKVRVTGYSPRRVVYITDKPAKALPAAVWQAYEVPADHTPDGLRPRAAELAHCMNFLSSWQNARKATDEQTALIRAAAVAGLVNEAGCSTGSPSWTEAGLEWARSLGAFGTVTA